ncbi:hypothetical protein [Sphingobium estronivorans]|uniref:hypothetical protein n=1 Tax=Sphingobium estronivorans TaxID=1577690 RepID=UPI001239C36C|nr:hypothetical protein [Sphingobium estronivorans]
MSGGKGAALVALGAAAGASLLALALYLVGELGEKEGDADGDRPVAAASPDPVRNAALRQRLGIVEAPLSAWSGAQQASGYARGLDAGPLAAIIAEIDSAQATAAASQAQAARLDALYRNDISASRRSVEAARAQASADIARLRLARQRIALEYGPGLATLGDTGVHQLVSRIAAGEAALVRIDIPGVLLTGGSIVQITAGEGQTSARVLGAAAASDSKLQSAGVLVVLTGPVVRQVLTGRVLAAQAAASGTVSGVLVPRDAIVRYQGQMWVYRREGGKFEREALVEPIPVSEGWLVRGGLTPGTVVVVHGGASLLALETRPAQSAGEDD